MKIRILGSLLLSCAALAAAPVIAIGRTATNASTALDVAGEAGGRADVAAPDTTPAPSPFALSDPDGHDLELQRLDVRTAVQGMLALTEVELRFRNPRQRRMEGRFSAILPEGAAVSRFAKEVDGRLMEGEVVERLRAHQVYDEILHEMRDPAMLDQEAGNRFSARVFPIEAGATVRLVLSYSTLLRQKGGERTYTLPLRGLPRVGVFTFHGSFRALPGESGRAETFLAAAGPGSVRDAGNARTIDRSDENFVPAQDLEVSWRPDGTAAPARVLTAGGFYVASFRPAVRAAQPAGAGGRWIFWLDTSASGADGGEHRGHAMQQVLAALPAGDVVELRAFDHRVTVLGQGTAAHMSARVAGLLAARRYLGGTDLEAVIRDVAAAARQPGSARLVVQTDGVATLGATDPAALRTAAAALPAGATVHALVLGARQDAPTLRTLTAGRGRVVVVPFSDSLDARARDAARRLRMPPGATFTASDAGAEWIHTVGADDVLPGDEVLVVGRVRAGGRAEPVLAGAGGPIAAGAAQALEAGSFAPLLEREAYRGYIDELVERASRTTDDSTRQALAREQVRVSVEHRVLSPLTTLLVLETERDYGRFGLDRRALAEILAVGDDGITRADRQPPPATVASSDVPAAADTVARDVDDRTEHVQPRVVRRVRESSQGAEAADRANADASAPLALQSVVVAGAASGNAQSAPARETPSPAPMAPPLPPPAPMAPPVPPPAPEPMPIVVPPPAPAPSGHGAGYGPAEMPEWTTPVPASAARVDSLRTRLRAAPRDREVRNQLADALWARGQWQELRTLALDWQPYDPENPQVYEALGEADVHLGRVQEAERALGSLVEVADGKPELLQRAGLLLLRVNAARLAETPLRTALAQRPDRVNGYRHLALMLWQSGRFAEAARVLEDASRRDFPGWYGDARRVVKEELGYVLRAWMAHEPGRAASIRGEAAEYGVDLDRRDALRVTLAWETDANDVDLHVVDPAGEEAYYAHQNTALGLDLYEDITRGFGPEVVRTAKVHAGDYPIGVTYFSAGPMGVSRGIVVVIRGDGPGAPVAQIFPFRLIEGNSAEVRHVATIHVGRR